MIYIKLSENRPLPKITRTNSAKNSIIKAQHLPQNQLSENRKDTTAPTPTMEKSHDVS